MEAYQKREPYQQRVIEEKDELVGRMHRLNTFLMDNHNKVSKEEKFALQIQLDAMGIYMNILEHRISNFAVHKTEES